MSDGDVIRTDEATLHRLQHVPTWAKAPSPQAGYARDIVEAFALSLWPACEVVPIAAPKQVEQALRQFCHRFPKYCVNCVIKHGRIFLTRRTYE